MAFGGRSLLARHLDLLFRFGVHTADLVIGFEADRIIEHVAGLATRPDVAYHFPWKTVTCWTATLRPATSR
jgi:hypothetical protein